MQGFCREFPDKDGWSVLTNSLEPAEWYRAAVWQKLKTISQHFISDGHHVRD
jgi:hypothetical protein